MFKTEVKRAPFSTTSFFLKKEQNKAKKKAKEEKKETGTNFNEFGYKLFTKIQMFFICCSLVLIPISLFPLEWMMFEYGRSFLLIFFTIVLFTFELIKFFIRGRLEIHKSPKDIILLFLGVSFLISLIFSSDFLISFWGYEYRFGTGFISIMAIFLYILLLKSMLQDFKSLVKLVAFFAFGFFLSAILSILSFYGINPFGFISEFEKFFFSGLPIFNSARLSIVVWSASILLSLFVFYHFFESISQNENCLGKKQSLLKGYRKKKAMQILLIFAFVVVLATCVFAITIFAVKNLFWLALLSLLTIFLITLLVTFLCQNKILQVIAVVIFASIILSLGILKIPFVQNILSIDKDNLVEQVTLDNESIWSITMSSLSESFPRSLVGLGNDNFIVAYSLYRPAFDGQIDLNFVNYSYANNEVYNIIANRGLIGLFVWLAVGFFLFRQMIQYLTDQTRKQILQAKSVESVGIFILEFLLIYIWIFAFFAYYSFMLYFVFFLLLALSSILKNIVYKMQSESLVIQTNFFVERIGLVRTDSLPKFFIFLVCFASVFSLYFLLKDFSSRIYAVKAESIIYDIKEGSIEQEKQEEMFQEAIKNYDEAISRNPNNYVFRRRVSSLLTEYVNRVLLKEYTNLTDENERKEFIRVVGVYAEATTEEARKATDLAPTISINWNNRDSIYSDLVKMGFHNYIDTAIKVSEQTIIRNPNNYNAYVNKSMYLYIIGDSSGAISYVRQALEINPFHISALALAGEISMKMQDYIRAKSYFEKAKALLEELDFTKTEVFTLYESVQKNLEYLWSLEVAADSKEDKNEEAVLEETVDKPTEPNRPNDVIRE